MMLVVAAVAPDQSTGWVARFQLNAGGNWIELGSAAQPPYARLLLFPPGAHLLRAQWTKDGVALASAATMVSCR